MASRRFRDQDTKLARRPPIRDARHRILVVCEGKKTEPQYFKAFQHHVQNRLVHVEIVGQAGVPVTAVALAVSLRDAAQVEARNQRDDNFLFDDVWCVLDVDEHPNLADACAHAERCAINIALSNPCFELWALLHFRDQTERIHRHQAQSALRKHLPGYDKEIEFRRLVDGYTQAVERASALDKTAVAVNESKRNPSTSVYVLTERIRKGGPGC